ncbi:MAG: DUF3990 domain-containing protein [bacterium]|nr:DUF3990 domain-containing protein [bacterium]
MNTDLVYHFNYKKVEYPVIRKDRMTKDFSWGFYCIETKQYAEKIAVFKTSVVNVYQVRNIKSLYIKKFDNYTEEWLEFVMNCRNGSTHNYDVVIGPMADETIYEYMDAYADGEMNKERFFQDMKEKYPVQQISFHTIKALDCIKFVECYEIG